jgi:hypothetical protein
MFLTTNPTELGSKYGSRSATLQQMKNKKQHSLQIKEDVEKSSNISVLFSRHRSVEDPGCLSRNQG